MPLRAHTRTAYPWRTLRQLARPTPRMVEANPNHTCQSDPESAEDNRNLAESIPQIGENHSTRSTPSQMWPKPPPHGQRTIWRLPPMCCNTCACIESRTTHNVCSKRNSWAHRHKKTRPKTGSRASSFRGRRRNRRALWPSEQRPRAALWRERRRRPNPMWKQSLQRVHLCKVLGRCTQGGRERRCGQTESSCDSHSTRSELGTCGELADPSRCCVAPRWGLLPM